LLFNSHYINISIYRLSDNKRFRMDDGDLKEIGRALRALILSEGKCDPFPQSH
jgi:hypothetical protein